MARALEAAHKAAMRFPGGRAALGECLCLMLDEIGAGAPRYEALGDIREEASWWADTATPQELELYTAAALRRIERIRFAEAPRKRLLAALWGSLTSDQKAAFAAKYMGEKP